MHDIRIFKVNGYIAIGMRRSVMVEREAGSVKMHRFVLGENLLRKSARRCGRECKIPIGDTLLHRKMFQRVLLCQDLRAFTVQLGIAVRMIKMPMRIDQMLDWIIAQGI